jgi:hypothetical protein
MRPDGEVEASAAKPIPVFNYGETASRRQRQPSDPRFAASDPVMIALPDL